MSYSVPVTGLVYLIVIINFNIKDEQPLKIRLGFGQNNKTPSI